jgi:peptidase M28-like protein
LRRATAIRWVFFVVVAALFLGSLAAIGITGPVVVHAPKLDVQIDPSPERLRHDVERLSVELAPRDAAHGANLDHAADWIAEELRRAGLEVELQAYEARGTTYKNVVGFRRGLDAQEPVRVIGAHYDARESSPGADDNASGVALLLEIARTLQAEKPRRSQYYVAFSTGEPPFLGTPDMGSRRFVEKLIERRVAVDIMVALDAVGYYDRRPGSQRFPWPGLGLLYPRAGDFVAVVGDTKAGPSIRQLKLALLAACELPVESIRAPVSLAWIEGSDERSFREAGLPSVLVTDTASLRNPHHHTPSDTADTLDYDRMVELVRCFHGLLWDRDVSG